MLIIWTGSQWVDKIHIIETVFDKGGELMKIGVVGNYGNDNQGDEAILGGILIQLEQAFNLQRQDIIVFTNNPIQTNRRFGVRTIPLFQNRRTDTMKFVATVIQNTPVIKKLDVLLMGGGGILQDLYRNNPIVYGMYSLMANWAKTPLMIYGPGVGPLRTRFGKIAIRSIANRAAAVTVRDLESKELLEGIGVRKAVEVIPDPALFNRSPMKKKLTDGKVRVGVTAVPYFNKPYWPETNMQKYKDYIKGMAANLDFLIERIPGAEVQFYSMKYPYDNESAQDIFNLMENQSCASVCKEKMDHRQIIDLASKKDIVIGTRLHSLILSLVARTPVIGISYHEKVENFMKTAGCDEYIIPIGELAEHSRFADLTEKMFAGERSREDCVPLIVEKLRSSQPEGMSLLRQLLEDRGIL